TDSIGDVALTLPLIGILRKKFPESIIIFLANTYTTPVVNCAKGVDAVWSWSDIQEMEDRQQISWLKSQNVDVFIHVFPRKAIARLAQKAKIPHRIGTSHRLFHMLTCNHWVNFTRKNSELHEAQLNTKLLKPLGISKSYSLDSLKNAVNFSNFEKLDNILEEKCRADKIQLILHPKSKGSALEWGVHQFIELAKVLPQDKFQIFFTGTEEEAAYFRNQLPAQQNIVDLSGKLSLAQLIAFIAKSNLLVAASTGPLHLAGLCNIQTIGLFTARRPLHPGRWKPLGKHVHIIIESKESARYELLNISVKSVAAKIMEVI
ncbi:MAG: glycosyltransferase family 9 protein, partial [Putridiphycobacter sp.]|nr:glycosyltransferase family 9 protein [Putridiphycobacter sp.]